MIFKEGFYRLRFKVNNDRGSLCSDLTFELAVKEDDDLFYPVSDEMSSKLWMGELLGERGLIYSTS